MTAPATPTPLDVLQRGPHGSNDLEMSALAAVRVLVEAALGYPCPFCGAVSHHDCQRDCPQRAYRNWRPATGSGDGGSGGEEE